MSKTDPTPPFDEAEREAWTLVLEAIEEAIDVEGLHAFDRAALARMHDDGSWHIGQKRLRVPAPAPSTDELHALRLPGRISRALFRRGLTIAELEAITDDHLLTVDGIGPVAVRIIRQALRRHHGEIHVAIHAEWLRRASCLTVEDVASRLGVETTTVAEWERWEPIDPEYADKLAALYGFTRSTWLLGEED